MTLGTSQLTSYSKLPAAPRSLCKIKNVVPPRLKKVLDLIAAPVLPGKEKADNRTCRAAVWDFCSIWRQV